jgi:hypothetical protein
MHKNSPLQFLTLLSSNKAQLTEEDGWLASTITAMTLSFVDADTFAPTVLNALRGHSHFAGISRLCVVQRVGVSNQLQVESVATSGSRENLMPRLYSCFIDPSGSLGAFSAGKVRFYSDVAAVVNSFKERGAPIQRSIGRIHKMGYGSGLCAPLTIELGQDPNENLLLSSIIGAARLYLADRPKLSSIYFETASRFPDHFMGSPFSAGALEDAFAGQIAALGVPSSPLRVRGSLGPTLVSHGNIAHLLARLVQHFHGFVGSLDVAAARTGEYNSFFLSCPTLPEERLNSLVCKVIRDDAGILGARLTLNQNSILIESPFDGETTEKYSIETEDTPVAPR